MSLKHPPLNPSLLEPTTTLAFNKKKAPIPTMLPFPHPVPIMFPFPHPIPTICHRSFPFNKGNAICRTAIITCFVKLTGVQSWNIFEFKFFTFFPLIFLHFIRIFCFSFSVLLRLRLISSSSSSFTFASR